MATTVNRSKDLQIEILPLKRKVVSARELVKLGKTKSHKIENIEFIRPKLGSKSLGKFVVSYEW